MLSTLLVVVLTVALNVFVHWLRTLDHRNRQNRRNVLYAPVGLVLFMGIVGCLICIGLTYAFFLPEFYENETWSWAIGFLLFGKFCVFTALDYDFRKAIWDAEKIVISRLFRATLTLQWSEIEKLERAELNSAWRLRFKDGEGFGFNDYMKGAESLAVACVRNSGVDMPANYEYLLKTDTDEVDMD